MIINKKTPLTENSSVLFVSFSRWIDGKRLPTNGSIEPLRDFLVPKVKKLVIIDQLHPGSEDVMPKIEVYNNHSFNFKSYKSSWVLYLFKPILQMSKHDNTQIRFKVRDFLSVIDWSFRDNTYYNFFIGLESINTIAGIFLRKIGRVGKVVYYVSDYSPNRFKSKWFNLVYLFLDRFCAMHADYIWDVSKVMHPARIKAGLDPKKSAPEIHIPNGLLPDQIKTNPVDKIIKNSIVYMGTLGPENGPDVVIKAMLKVRTKIPEAKLHIVGGTNKDFIWLNKIIKHNDLQKAVVFHGFIPNSVEMSKIIRTCAIGVAPYRSIPGSMRWYADAGKIRAYCASGLPVISSHVPPLGLEAAEKGAAVVVKDTPNEFADAILNILTDAELYLKLRKNAILFAKDSTWENTFSNAFSKMI